MTRAHASAMAKAYACIMSVHECTWVYMPVSWSHDMHLLWPYVIRVLLPRTCLLLDRNSNRGAWHLQRSSFVNSSVYNLSSNVVLLVHRCVLFAFDHMSTSLFQKSDSSNISRIFNASATWETNHLCTSASSNETSKDAGHRLDRADMFPVWSPLESYSLQCNTSMQAMQC